MAGNGSGGIKPHSKELVFAAVRLYFEEKKSCLEVAAALGVSKTWVLRKLRQHGELRSLKDAFSISSTHARALKKSGPDSMSYRNGRLNRKDGYIGILVPGHPNGFGAGYVLEHRLVMEREIGRYLRPDEVVHHINRNRKDNRIENLQLTDRSQHMSRHLTNRWRDCNDFPNGTQSSKANNGN